MTPVLVLLSKHCLLKFRFSAVHLCGALFVNTDYVVRDRLLRRLKNN